MESDGEPKQPTPADTDPSAPKLKDELEDTVKTITTLFNQQLENEQHQEERQPVDSNVSTASTTSACTGRELIPSTSSASVGQEPISSTFSGREPIPSTSTGRKPIQSSPLKIKRPSEQKPLSKEKPKKPKQISVISDEEAEESLKILEALIPPNARLRLETEEDQMSALEKLQQHLKKK